MMLSNHPAEVEGLLEVTEVTGADRTGGKSEAEDNREGNKSLAGTGKEGVRYSNSKGEDLTRDKASSQEEDLIGTELIHSTGEEGLEED